VSIATTLPIILATVPLGGSSGVASHEKNEEAQLSGGERSTDDGENQTDAGYKSIIIGSWISPTDSPMGV
jgi:hypothetical protein